MWGRVIGLTTVGTFWIHPSYPPLYIAHRLVSPRRTPQWLTATSAHTPSSDISQSPPAPCPPGPTPILRRLPSAPPSPKSVLKAYGGNPQILPSSCPRPPRFFSYTGALPGKPPCTSSSGNLLALPSSSAPSTASLVTAVTSASWCIRPPIWYYWRWLFVQGRERQLFPWEGLGWTWYPPGLLQNNYVASPARGKYLCCCVSGICSEDTFSIAGWWGFHPCQNLICVSFYMMGWYIPAQVR